LASDQSGGQLWGLSDGRLYQAPGRPDNAESVAAEVQPRYPVLFSGSGSGPVAASDFSGRDLGAVPGSDGGIPVLAVRGNSGPGLLVRWRDRVA
jgi:hypothetical protein